jgi:hypothetical protein
MPIPIDTKLYEKAKMIADNTYKTHGAYKSAFLVKTYKSLGGRYVPDGKPRKLSQWIKEEWKDIGNKTYPVYRPTKIVHKTTPLTVNEIDKKDLQRQITLKQKIKNYYNLPPFKKIR